MALKRQSRSQENVDGRKSETHSSLFSCARQCKEMGQWQVLGFPFVCPAGFLLGAEKEDTKPPGWSSSACSCLGESTREKLTQSLPALDAIQQPTPFPQDTILCSHNCSHSHGLSGVPALPRGWFEKARIKGQVITKSCFCMHRNSCRTQVYIISRQTY